jgi:hypothetical protein
MPSIRRRYFLQCAGSTIALWGLSQAKAIRKNDAYGKAMAQDTSQIIREPLGKTSFTEARLARQEEVHQLPLPGEMMLRIGIDESLDKDPLVSELIQRSRRIEVIDLQDGEVDYIIGRATVQAHQEGLNRIAANSIGLFLPDFHPIANTFGSSIESVSNAINRLSYALDKLLITHIVRAIANAGTSRPRVKATVQADGQDVQLAYLGQGSEQSPSVSQLTPVFSGGQVSFRIENQESIPVYLSLFAIDSEQNTVLVYPRIRRSSTTSFGSQVLPPAEEITIPSADDGFQLQVGGDGDLEIFLIAATHPLDLTPHRALYGSQTLDLYAAEEILQNLYKGANAEGLQYAALSVRFAVD